jgi:hypothetical protein
MYYIALSGELAVERAVNLSLDNVVTITNKAVHLTNSSTQYSNLIESTHTKLVV